MPGHECRMPGAWCCVRCTDRGSIPLVGRCGAGDTGSMKVPIPKVVLSVPGVPVEALMLQTLKLIVPIPLPKPHVAPKPARKRPG